MLSILRNSLVLSAVVGLTLGAGACGKSSSEGDRGQGSRHAPTDTPAGARTPGQRAGTAGGRSSSGAPPANSTAVPVEVATVERRSISFYIQSNGTLEAENEVDVVARTNGPIDELRTEEGRVVSKGQLLARIEDDEIRALVEIGRVSLQEARLNFERAERLYGIQLLSPEDYEQAGSRFETAQAQYHGNQLQLGYTEIRAPFSGHIVARYIDVGQQVSAGTPLFRLSDFDPLLCPIQVPERELPRLVVGQAAYLTVEAWPDERFEAQVLRISPVIDAGTGTVKVTLEISARDKLRPGMFARVFLETDTHSDAIVVPKTALSLESLGDAVFVYRDGRAERREIEVGFEEGDSVEVLSGVAPGEQVVVVGQDGLSHGTPIQVLGGFEVDSSRMAPSANAPAEGSPGFGGRRSFGDRRGARGMPDLSRMRAEDLDRLRERMRSRGLSDAEIEERLERLRESSPVSESTESTKDPSSPQR